MLWMMINLLTTPLDFFGLRGAVMKELLMSVFGSLISRGILHTNTQSFISLSRVASVLATGLFASFAGILFLGMTHVAKDPVAILSTPGISVCLSRSYFSIYSTYHTAKCFFDFLPYVACLSGFRVGRAQ